MGLWQQRESFILGCLDWNEMDDIPIKKSKFKKKTLVNYNTKGTSSFQHSNPSYGMIGNLEPNVENVLIDAFHCLPKFPGQLSISTS